MTTTFSALSCQCLAKLEALWEPQDMFGGFLLPVAPKRRALARIPRGILPHFSYLSFCVLSTNMSSAATASDVNRVTAVQSRHETA